MVVLVIAGASAACAGPGAPDRARAEAAFGRGAELHGSGYGRDAERAYRDALAADPTAAGTYNALGVLSAQWGRFGTAEAHFRRAIRADPTFARAYYERALLRLRMRDYETAIGLLEHAATLAPDDADIRVALDAAYRGLAGPSDAANPKNQQ